MYSKIAIKNVKKSLKDYAIYFLTLTLAVCIFYSFNSIESQKALMEMKGANSKNIDTLMKIIEWVSVFVSVILGSLILYANNFLIKKRKKELGIYMTLGMGKGKISRILVTETIIVGAISLISGVFIGIGSSQLLSTFALKLFDLSISDYRFSVSPEAIGKTIVYFGIMFLLVILFNVLVISKYKMIDLLTASKKNENIKFKSPVIYLITFSICVLSLGFAYKTILEIGLEVSNTMFPVTIILGIIGTILFFFSLSGFILYIVKKNKKIYFKELNIFIIKQINSKVNTNFVSMSLICLMLFVTITALSTGISFKEGQDKSLTEATPFDASVILDNSDENYTIEDILNKFNFDISSDEKYVCYNLYDTEMTINEFLNSDEKKFNGYNIDFIKSSDYNKILQLKGKKEINLKDDEVLVLSNMSVIIDFVNERLKDSNEISIDGKEFSIKNNSAIEENLQTDSFRNNLLTIVINDEYLDGYNISRSVLNVNYLGENREGFNEKYRKVPQYFSNEDRRALNIDFIYSVLKDDAYEESKGLTTIVLFVGMYIGIVFLITSMAVLALQQLSEASDSLERYKSLKKIGSNKRMIDKTIFIQTLVYFSLPVILAFVHSVIGISVMNDFINIIQPANIIVPALITTGVFIIIYIGYFYTTYIGYKNIVKSNL